MGAAPGQFELDYAAVWDLSPIAPGTLPPRHKNSVGMEFALVPKGKAWTGALAVARALNTEFNQPFDFYLGVYEVTQQEWTALMGNNPSHFSRLGGGKDDVAKIDAEELKRFPVENL